MASTIHIITPTITSPLVQSAVHCIGVKRIPLIGRMTGLGATGGVGRRAHAAGETTAT